MLLEVIHTQGIKPDRTQVRHSRIEYLAGENNMADGLLTAGESQISHGIRV